MRLMIISTLTLAGLAIGIQCCPPLKERMTTVIFGQQAEASQAAPEDHLVARAADKVRDGAASALETVEAKAAELAGTRRPAAKPAPAAKDRTNPPTAPAVQQKS